MENGINDMYILATVNISSWDLSLSIELQILVYELLIRPVWDEKPYKGK